MERMEELTCNQRESKVKAKCLSKAHYLLPCKKYENESTSYFFISLLHRTSIKVFNIHITATHAIPKVRKENTGKVKGSTQMAIITASIQFTFIMLRLRLPPFKPFFGKRKC